METTKVNLYDGESTGEIVPPGPEKPTRPFLGWRNNLSEEKKLELTGALLEAAIPPEPATHLDAKLPRGVLSFASQEAPKTPETFKHVVKEGDTLESILYEQLKAA
jgi:hypothetical protein